MSATDYEIRTADSDDIPVLVRARRLMYEELDDWDSDTLDRIDAECVEYLERGIGAGRVVAWVAVHVPSGEWVGAIAAEWVRMPTNPKVARELRSALFGLYVKREHRRRGIARDLVNVAIAKAREAGAGAVTLHASEYGMPLYESLGFYHTTEMRLVLDGDPRGGC